MIKNLALLIIIISLLTSCNLTAGNVHDQNDLYFSIGKKLDNTTNTVQRHTLFTSGDSEVVAILKYYTPTDNSKITLRLYKLFNDSAEILTIRELDFTPPNNILISTLKVSDLYNTNGIGPGDFKIEYLDNDSSIISGNFRLK